MFISMIVIRCMRNPDLAPKVDEHFSRADLVAALKETWALPAIVAVLTGILVGLFSPTEAGAVGAALALLLAATRGGLTLASRRSPAPRASSWWPCST